MSMALMMKITAREQLVLSSGGITVWRYLVRGSAEEAEAITCKDGLTLSADWCAQQVVLESDCSTVAAMLQAKSGGENDAKIHHR
jgi:hypothetical protein